MNNKKCYGPFQLWVLNNFPFTIDDWDSITQYQMLCKCLGALKEQLDVNSDIYKKIQDIENYLANLDLQEEVNNKINQMVEDGTFDEIINQTLFNELNEQVTTNKNDIVDLKAEDITLQGEIDTLTTNVNGVRTDVNNLKLKKLRKDLYNNYHLFNKPVTMNSFFDKFKIYESNDKKNYKITISKDDLKVNTSHTYYISKTGSNDNNGTSWENAWANMFKLINTVDDYSTIYIKEGIYYRSDIPMSSNFEYYKNLNIIGDGQVIMAYADPLEYTQNSTYSNVYQVAKTNISEVIDISGRKNNLFPALLKVNSLVECADNINTYYHDGSILYINNGGVVNNDNILVTLLGTKSIIKIRPNSANNNTIYLENIVAIGSDEPTVFTLQNGTYNSKANLHTYNCQFYYGGRGTACLRSAGCNTIYMNTKVAYSHTDGISYIISNNMPCYSLEVNCESSNNGLGYTDNSCNGSTAHSGSQIVRINGNYFNNQGANVGDIHDNTISLNFNCNAFDSKAITDNPDTTNFPPSNSCDFGALGNSAKVYIYNCFAKGKSLYNLRSNGDATLYNSNSEYDTTGGNGTIVNI
jgi:hypothetical protein